MVLDTGHVGSVAGLCGSCGEFTSRNKQDILKGCNDFLLFEKFILEYLHVVQALPLLI